MVYPGADSAGEQLPQHYKALKTAAKSQRNGIPPAITGLRNGRAEHRDVKWAMTIASLEAAAAAGPPTLSKPVLWRIPVGRGCLRLRAPAKAVLLQSA
jgi:hypothetical protein